MSSIEDGNLKLREGEFENARKIFSSLLDAEPENLDLISSFFISSYWDNRLDMVLTYNEGRERGTKLVQMFDEFELEIERRSLTKNSSYNAITQCVLSEASLHFRLAYQSEGIAGLDKKILNDLSICLIKVGDYKNAVEIIEYSKNFLDTPAGIVFYEAECLFHLGEVKRSLLYFREGLLYDPDLLRFDIIRSEPLHSIIAKLKPKFESESDLKEYLPVYCLERNLLPEIRQYSRDDIRLLNAELERLSESLKGQNEAYTFKLKCRILQIGMTILDSHQSKYQQDMCRKITQTIRQIDPELLERREKFKKQSLEGSKQ